MVGHWGLNASAWDLQFPYSSNSKVENLEAIFSFLGAVEQRRRLCRDRRHVRSTVSHEGLASEVTQGATDALPWASSLSPFWARPVGRNTRRIQSADLSANKSYYIYGGASIEVWKEFCAEALKKFYCFLIT